MLIYISAQREVEQGAQLTGVALCTLDIFANRLTQ